MSGKTLVDLKQRLFGVTVTKTVFTANKILSGYYHSRDRQAFQQCLLELLAIIATSYEEVDQELRFLRSAVLGEDKEQTDFR